MAVVLAATTEGWVVAAAVAVAAAAEGELPSTQVEVVVLEGLVCENTTVSLFQIPARCGGLGIDGYRNGARAISDGQGRGR